MDGAQLLPHFGKHRFQEMFEQSMDLKEPWHITKAVFDERERAAHLCISARTTAQCRRPGVKCPEHGVHVVDAPWARSPYARITLKFGAYAVLLAQTMSMNETRRLLRISRTSMLHIAQYWVDKAGREDGLGGIARLSLDETLFKRGQSYVTVIGSPKQKRVMVLKRGVAEQRWNGSVRRERNVRAIVTGYAM